MKSEHISNDAVDCHIVVIGLWRSLYALSSAWFAFFWGVCVGYSGGATSSSAQREILLVGDGT